MSIIRLDQVSKTFQRVGAPAVHALTGVSLQVQRGETVALIGESGSGKSTLGRLALRLMNPDQGKILFDGEDVTTLEGKELRALRRRMQVVFQEPSESLNPRMRIERIVAEPLEIHHPDLTSDERRRRVREALEQTGLSDSHAARFPAELSGGQQQRVGIARAIVTRPEFIVLDEPTSSLDLSVRAQILDLLAQLQSELDIAYLFISHDIHTVRYVADKIAVMYLGHIVEIADTTSMFADPRHPYTSALLSARLSTNPDEQLERLKLVGEIGRPDSLPSGCVLAPRCPIVSAECTEKPVPLHPYLPLHHVACIKAEEADVLLRRAAASR